MSKLANPLGIRVAKQKGLFWSDNHPFYHKKSSFRDFLHLSRYLDFVFIHFQRYLRTIYSQPPFIALGRNYNVTGFGADRSLVIDLHYFDLFGTLSSVPRRVGNRYLDGVDSLKEARWKLFANPKLARRTSFYSLFHIFSLGSLFNMSLETRKKKSGFVPRKIYTLFLNRLFKPRGNKTLHVLSTNLGYRAMSNFMYLAYCSSSLAPDVALVRFKRVAAEVRLKLMLLHMIRRTKIIKKRNPKKSLKKSKSYLIRGWRVLFKKEKDRKRAFRLERESNLIVDKEYPFVEPKREARGYNYLSGRYRYYDNIRRRVARLKSNITFRWPYRTNKTGRDIKYYVRLLNLINKKTYYSFFTRKFARAPVFPNYTLYRQLGVKVRSFKAALITTNLKVLNGWASRDKSKWDMKKKLSGCFGRLYDLLVTSRLRRAIVLRYKPKIQKQVQNNFYAESDYEKYIKKIPNFHLYPHLFEPEVRKRQKPKREVYRSARAGKKNIHRLRRHLVRRRFHKTYGVIKNLFKVKRYIESRRKILAKIFAIGKSAVKFRYVRHANKVISRRDKHFSWIRPKRQKPLEEREIDSGKRFAVLGVKRGIAWTSKRNQASNILPRLQYVKKKEVRQDLIEVFRVAAWRAKRTFYNTYMGILQQTASLIQRFRRGESDESLASTFRLFKEFNKKNKEKEKEREFVTFRRSSGSGDAVFYFNKSKHLRLRVAQRSVSPFIRKWRGVNTGLLVVRRHKNFMFRMKQFEPVFFKKRGRKHRLYRRRRTRYFPIGIKQQAVWKMLRFGTNLTASLFTPLGISTYKKSSNIKKEHHTTDVNFGLLTFSPDRSKNSLSTLKAIFLNKAVGCGNKNVNGLRQRSILLWNNNRLINNSLGVLASRGFEKTKKYSNRLFKKRKIHFLPVGGLRRFGKFGVFGLRPFNRTKKKTKRLEEIREKRFWSRYTRFGVNVPVIKTKRSLKNLKKSKAGAKAIHPMLKKRTVIYSATGQLKRSIISKRKDLIFARKFYLEQLVDTANKQKFLSSKYRFFRQRLSRLSRNRQRVYRKLKRRAQRRRLTKPLPFGTQRRFFQASHLRDYIQNQLDEQGWIYGPARHHRIYRIRKLFRIHFFILNMLYMEGLTHEVKFVGMRSYYRWERFRSLKETKDFSIMRGACMNMGVIYQLYFRSVILKNKLVGYMIVYFFQYIVMTYFEKMFNKFLTMYNFKSICVRLNPTDDFLSAAFIGKFIIGELRKEFSVQYVLKQIRRGFALILKQGRLRGYRILLSGRFARRQMATYLAQSRGQVALGAVSANIDYSMFQFVARFGMCAVKVWLDVPTEENEAEEEADENEQDREEEDVEA